ncbi:MAG: LpqB family beta-propeller domain-containing protein [Actinomycetota bacterium]|nr:LpqB family beta-propeller domain-containing protein [Actinomycetota bacterium]
MSRLSPGGRSCRGRLLAALFAVTAVVTGCSGVPRSSVPLAVRTLDDAGNPTPELTVRPEPDDDPRTTVDKFLQANVSKDEQHPTARTFLTDAAAGKWQDRTVTVVDDYRVGVLDHGVLPVTGRIVGSLDSIGVYTPTLAGAGASQERTFLFRLTSVNRQWRISEPPRGLLIRRSDFEATYRRRPLYFFDQQESRLVPDLRYSAAEQQSLATWLLTELITGAQPALQATLRNEFPDQLKSERAKVTLGAPVVSIQLPGLSQAEPQIAARVAAQIAYTFYSFQASQPITLLDGPTPVPLGASIPANFTRETFASLSPVPSTTPSLYYVRNGALVGAASLPVPGPAGTGRYALRSVAVTGTEGDLTVAGLASPGTTLFRGPARGALSPVSLPAPATTRPDFRPGPSHEVWLGAGPAVLRVIGAKVTRVAVTAVGPAPLGQKLLAVRFSPDGARVALVYAAPANSSVWIGTVGTGDEPVRIESLRQVTPMDWRVTDVAWSDAESLRAIGSSVTNGDIEIWSFAEDGTAPELHSAANLPAAPDAVAAGSGVSTVVSAAATVWREEPGGGWADALPRDKPDGSAPIFAG